MTVNDHSISESGPVTARTGALGPLPQSRKDKPLSALQLQVVEERERKRADAIKNAQRNGPIQVRFHEWMEQAGFRPMPIPSPGKSYSGAHIEALWEAYLDATLRERDALR
jgi:hypothetical protein